MSRRCKNWLETLSAYAEDTESPRNFWIWTGIYILSSALERRCWMPFGMETIYPNLFLMIIAPPGKCRKGSPVGFAKRILTDLDFNVFVDSASKRALTKQLDEISKTHQCTFQIKDVEGTPITISQCPLCLISKELSSFFAVNLKEMVEVLTDLFDSHDTWDYKTSDKGEDKIFGVCVNALFASTPNWIARNLPEEAIGGGFTSRFVIVYGNSKYKYVPIPPQPPAHLYKALSEDLGRIKQLSGEFAFSPNAEKLFIGWYKEIQKKAQKCFDERVGVFLERQHVIAIKAAMGIHVAYSDNLIISEEDMATAIVLCEQIEKAIPDAFGGHGRADLAQGINTVSSQLRMLRKASVNELMRMNFHNINRPELLEVLSSMKLMGTISSTYETRKGRDVEMIEWKGSKAGKENP
jgi:hypothetical protein